MLREISLSQGNGDDDDTDDYDNYDEKKRRISSDELLQFVTDKNQEHVTKISAKVEIF